MLQDSETFTITFLKVSVIVHLINVFKGRLLILVKDLFSSNIPMLFVPSKSKCTSKRLKYQI